MCMDANKLWVLRDFIGINKVLFKIPVYQRNYDWSVSNCNRLLDDIKKIIDTGEKHFIGTFVYMPLDGGLALREYTIIDGQQRLTTIIILLKALADVSQSRNDGCYDEIQKTYLHNQFCQEEFKVKLKPIQSDNDQFLALLRNNMGALDEDSHIFINYNLCKERLQKWIESGITPSQIHEALQKLEIVEISLNQKEDDPQIIFESINSTGLELSNADLIRNFLLMNAPNQEDLYENYWLYIEKALKHGTDYSNLNLFFMHYIMYKTNSPVNNNRLYEKFAKFFKDNGYTPESSLEELKFYADIFKAFVYDNNKYANDINKILKKLRQLKQTTCYPFLLHVFDDYERKVIDEKVLQKILNLILAYLVRRSVCAVPSNSLRGLFIYLYNRVFNVIRNKKKYYEAINKFLFTITSKDVMPSGSDFERALMFSNLYANLTLCKYLLIDIESGDNKELLNTETLTIEHIMPQTLNSEWSHISEDDHEKYLHTLGNLSISGYNSELSNKNFLEKKRIITENSRVVTLNADVRDKDEWTINDIKKRSRRLTDILLERYYIEKINDESIEFDFLNTITLTNYENVTGKKLVSFTFEGNVYRQNKYVLMLLEMIQILERKKPGKLRTLAEHDFSFNLRSRKKHKHLSLSADKMRQGVKIDNDIYIETNLSAYSIMQFIDCLLGEYGENKSAFSISVIAEEDDELGDSDE